MWSIVNCWLCLCWCIAPAKLQSTEKVDDVENAINSCLSNVSGDMNSVVDVIRKAIADDVDDSRFVVGEVFQR